MNSLLITQKELKVNGYPVGAIPALGFDYTYLYYEPQLENSFKILKVGEEFVRSELNDAEVAICVAYCEAFTPEVVSEPSDSAEPVDPTQEEMVDCVLANGKPGHKKRKDLLEGEIEIDHTKIEYAYPMATNTMQVVWDPASESFVGETYVDKRLCEFYKMATFNGQLDAIWKFIDAYKAAGNSLPAETDAMLTQVKTIKATYPKE